MMEAKKQRLRQPHRLLQALSCGVVALLSSTEAARVLCTCREIRFDESIASCALRSATPSPRWRVVGHPMAMGTATSAFLKMLQHAWRMDKLLTTLAANPTTKMMDGATVDVQGFMMLTDTVPMTMDATIATATRGWGQVAAPTGSSRFKAHWTHLSSPVDRHDAVVCELCETAVASICSYREETERFANDLEEEVLRAEERWESEGRSASEIFELSYDFQQACMENEPFYDAYVANRNDESVLSHVVSSGRFPLDSHAGCPGDLMAVLGGRTREACREVYQSLRRLLAAMCGPHVAHTVALTEHGKPVDVVAGCLPCGLRSSLVVGCVVAGE